jgi:predicted P-loop ATPase
MKVAFYDGGARDTSARVADLDWSALVTLLTTHRPSAGCIATPCPDRKCPAKLAFPGWSPVALSTPRRANDNVTEVTVAVFDLDHLTEAQVDALDLSGLAWVLYSTHSSKPGDICLRLAMPLSRGVLPHEWQRVRAAAVAQYRLPADPNAKDLSRFFFLPDAPPGTDPLSASADGAPLDVDALLKTRVPEPPPAPVATPIDLSNVPTDVHELAQLLKAHARQENRALVGRVLRGEAFAPLGEQDTTLQALMSTVAFCLPDTTSDEAIVHMLRPSFAATNWQDGTEHLIAEALKKLHRARERKAKRDEERLAKNKAIRERIGMREPTAAPVPLDEGEAEDPETWVDSLLTIERRDKTGKVTGIALKNCEANVELVLRRSHEWRNVLRFNEVTKQLECVNPPKDISSSKPEGLDIEIAVWFQRSDYGKIGLMPKPALVQDVLRQVARASAYDPLRDYLTGVAWDGTKRIGSFLRSYLGATDDDDAYLDAVSTRWFVSAVARGLSPGTKVDTVLILEGPQGLRKSTAIEALAQPWFCDSKVDVTNKDSWALAAQFWMIELAENETMSQSQKETLKAFFARRMDTYRPPYGKVNATTGRRALFISTTNMQEYLQLDPSGYRRYWPAWCTKIDIQGIRRDRDQLFAEAVAIYRAGETCSACAADPDRRCNEHRWWLSDVEVELAREATKRREQVVGEIWQDPILDWILRKAPEKRPDRVTVREILVDALKFEQHQLTKSREMEITAVLHSLGFKRCIRTRNGLRAKAWETPAELLEAPQQLSGAPAAQTKAA